ncbi:MAG: resolvase [Rhodospirillales bacterium]|nr:resolvase [Rhodospirillales bacterium]
MGRAARRWLLGAIRSKLIDLDVVNKVDRLTRTLAEFAMLVELFDAEGVSFVSVTQSFNTLNAGESGVGSSNTDDTRRTPGTNPRAPCAGALQ